MYPFAAINNNANITHPIYIKEDLNTDPVPVRFPSR